MEVKIDVIYGRVYSNPALNSKLVFDDVEGRFSLSQIEQDQTRRKAEEKRKHDEWLKTEAGIQHLELQEAMREVDEIAPGWPIMKDEDED